MKVFISHSWNDKSLATEINETLQKDGHEVWFDIHQLIPGDNIQLVIDTYINKCDVIVLLWTIHAFGSNGVEAEIHTAKRLNKRIIPIQADHTPLDHQQALKGLLSIPFDDKETGMLLLQRALLMLMAEPFQNTSWFKEAFGNVVDLGGYLNYANTYRLKQNKNDDGHKDVWVQRLEGLRKQNEFIREQLMPKVQNKMQELQAIMHQLEKGNASLEELKHWQLWCSKNEDLQPELIKQLSGFIAKDIVRLQTGGAPVSSLNIHAAETAINRLKKAIDQKKDEAYNATTSRIKKFAGLFISDKTINAIASSYLSYVTHAPTVLQELVNEASVSEYVAVKETTVRLVNYLENQDHEKEQQRANLDGYFDDAYLINNTVKLLVEAKLVNKDRFSLDFISMNVIDNYVSFILDAKTKSQLELLLMEIRNIIGLKKNEINWGQVAAVVIGAAVVGSIANEFMEAGNAPNASSGNSPFFEDQVASFSAKYGGGLDANFPIQY